MANKVLESMTFDPSKSDLNPDKGITLAGSYTTSGNGTNPGDSWLSLQVTDSNNNTYVITSSDFSATFKQQDNTWTLKMTEKQLSDNGIDPHETLTFKILSDGNTAGTGDDKVFDLGPITIACYYAGTMIATPNGEVAVETLAIGDMVLLHDGSVAPVRWMGRNTVMKMFADKNKALPIRIKKDALAANVPSRDLLVSPDHAMFVDGILAQAGALVNGTSIVRETNVPAKFVYHHIELETHALVVAENAPAETFIDNIDRMNYDNWAEHEALYGDLPALVEMDLPRAKSQRQVPPATRKRLADRAVELGYSSVDSAVA
jgi:hypothetical protein